MKPLLLLISLLISSTTTAAEWFYITESDSDSDNVIYIDYSSIIQNGASKKKAWVQFVYKNNEKRMALTSFDCAKREISNLASNKYDADGKLETQNVFKVKEYTPIAPESLNRPGYRGGSNL